MIEIKETYHDLLDFVTDEYISSLGDKSKGSYVLGYSRDPVFDFIPFTTILSYLEYGSFLKNKPKKNKCIYVYKKDENEKIARIEYWGKNEKLSWIELFDHDNDLSITIDSYGELLFISKIYKKNDIITDSILINVDDINVHYHYIYTNDKIKEIDSFSFNEKNGFNSTTRLHVIYGEDGKANIYYFNGSEKFFMLE